MHTNTLVRLYLFRLCERLAGSSAAGPERFPAARRPAGCNWLHDGERGVANYGLPWRCMSGAKRALVAALIRDVFALALRVPHPRRRRDLRRRGHDLIAVSALRSGAGIAWSQRARGVWWHKKSKRQETRE